VEATRATNPLLESVTLERLRTEGTVPLNITREASIPFANLRFPTPSGKVELRSETLATQGLDPLPSYQEPAEFAARPDGDSRLTLISGAAHHFVSSSLANQPGLLAKEGEPYIELHSADAAARGIAPGDLVEVASARGSCQLRAVITDAVRQGVASAPKGRWARLGADGRNINWTTSDALADLAGQSTFHSNLVEVRLVMSKQAAPAAEVIVAD
jgi:anaerobic selenocysteine-containing dehydrogenase